MINLKSKSDCCGCCACANICPQKCIEMYVDKEGFVYPLINNEKCLKCKLCIKVCPIINVKADTNNNEFKQKGFIVQNKNRSVLRESTSGGAFSAIAEYVIENEGVVFGVSLNTNLNYMPSPAKHIYVESISEIGQFRNSKYVQSYVGTNTYQKVKEFLLSGRMVCFSGTPCQIEALNNYLSLQSNVDSSKLILVDVVCRAVPSPLVFRKYIEYQERALKHPIESIHFRDKHYGYKYSTVNLVTKENAVHYHKGADSDLWLRAFLSNICSRPSCYNCKFRKIHRVSDFTLWDCFNVGRFSKQMDNDLGATRVLIHSKKGMQVFKRIQHKLLHLECEPEAIIKGARELQESPLPHKNRKQFFIDIQNMDAHELFDKYFPYNFKVRSNHIIRMTCYKLGIYSIAKKAYVIITKKY